MTGAHTEVNVARQALERAREDLLKRLDPEPAWRALRQLEQRLASGEPGDGIDFNRIRVSLVERLDAAIPEWRNLAAIEAAISALGPGEPPRGRGRSSPPPLPTEKSEAPNDGGAGRGARVPGAEPARAKPEQVWARSSAGPPPLPAPHVRIEPERTRYAPATPRPPAQKGSRVPAELTPRPVERISKASPPPLASVRRPASAGGRLAAALGFGGDGPARLSAIEAEVERMMRQEAGTWTGQPPPPSERRVRGPHDGAPAPDADRPSPPGGDAEEAMVEIIPLAPVAKAAGERRPITKLADRLKRVTDSETAQSEPVVSLEAHSEEASVEIVPAKKHDSERLRGKAPKSDT